MFLTRFSLSCAAAAVLVSSTGCLNHTRVLYQPKPFKRATVPPAASDSGPGVERPATEPPPTAAGAAEGLVPPAAGGTDSQ